MRFSTGEPELAQIALETLHGAPAQDPGISALVRWVFLEPVRPSSATGER